MENITERKALNFAKQMGNSNPPTEINKINAHIEWWNNNYPDLAVVIEKWYNQWQKKVIGDKINRNKYNSAYNEFMNLLVCLPSKILTVEV